MFQELNDMKYGDLQDALEQGHLIERCTTNKWGGVEGWHPVAEIDERWEVNRYRIVRKDGVVLDPLDFKKREPRY